MKVNFLKIKDMAKENIFGKIKIISQDNFKKMLLSKETYIN